MRLYRLLSPGIVFATVGLFVLVAGELPWFHLRGGLTTTGAFAFALQVVLSALLVSAIDDLSGGGLAFPGRRLGRRTGKLIDISARPISFRQALVEFHRRPLLPALLLGFGVGASLSALAVGAFQEEYGPVPFPVLKNFGSKRSEVVLGATLVVGAALLLRRGGRSYFGWVIGMTFAAVMGQIAFVETTDHYRTIVGWGALMIGLFLLRVLVAAVEGRRRIGSGKSSVKR